MTLDKALEEVPELRKVYDNDQVIRELIDTAKKLEGLVRERGFTHRRGDCAAAVDRTGAAEQDEERRNCDGYDMKAVEKMGC